MTQNFIVIRERERSVNFIFDLADLNAITKNKIQKETKKRDEMKRKY